MQLAIVRHELSELRRSHVLGLLVTLATVASWLAVLQGGAAARFEIEAVRRAEAAAWSAWTAQTAKGPHAAAHHPMLIACPPPPLAAIAPGVAGSLGRHVYTDAHRVIPVRGARGADAPLIEQVGRLDLTFVIAVVFSLVMLVLGVDLVAGEKERGTLRLVFAQPVSRVRWYLLRLFTRLAAALCALGTGVVAGFALAGGAPLGEGGLVRLAAWTALSSAYLSVWLAVGSAASACARSLAAAALYAVGLWIAFTLILPRVLMVVSLAVSPPPPSAPATLTQRVEAVRARRAQRAMVEEAKAAGRLAGATGFVAFEGDRTIRDAIDSRLAKFKADAEAELEAWRKAQLARLASLAYLAPAALYAEAASEVAGSDWSRHADFVRQAGAYRARFLATLNGLEDQGVAEYRDFARMERFRHEEPDARSVVARARAPLATLVLLAAAATGIGLGAFLRYDLR